MHPAEDRRADEPHGGAVARDEIEQVQFRRIEREYAGSFLPKREKRLGAKDAAANQQ